MTQSGVPRVSTYHKQLTNAKAFDEIKRKKQFSFEMQNILLDLHKLTIQLIASEAIDRLKDIKTNFK